MDIRPIEQAIALLKNTNAQITELLEQPFPEFHIRSNHVLERLIHGLLHAIGSSSRDEQGNAFEIVSLAEIWEKENASTVVSPSYTTITNPEEDIAALRTTVEKLYRNFLSRNNDDILEAVLPLEIKAVAKLAGIDPIDQPEVIDYAFIDKIKAAIKEKEVEQKKKDDWLAKEEQKLPEAEDTKQLNIDKKTVSNNEPAKKISKKTTTKK